jgi:hypothetical protein
MPISHKSHWLLSGLLIALPASSAVGQASPTVSVADLTARQVTAYLARLADLHCTESVTQERLAPNGHVEASEHARYDYLVMIDGSGDDLQLNESRIESAASRHKPLPMLVTNGFSTALLVFHPYYRDSFTFEVGSGEVLDGREVIPVHFSPVPGRRTPAALALRGRDYPLELQGTACIEKQSGEVDRMEASLLHNMSDVGLRSLSIHVEYKPAMLGKNAASMTLPSLAVVEVTTPLQHWRNTHVFDAYKSFSTDAEQDANVKIRAESATPKKDNITTTATSDDREKP